MTSPVPNIPVPTQELINTTNAQSIAVLDAIADLQITTDEEYESAVDILKEVKRAANELEAARTSITKPMNDAVKAVNAQFVEPSSRLSIAETRLKHMTSKYVADKRAEQQRMIAEAAIAAAAARANSEHSAAVTDVAKVIEQAAAAAAPAVSGVSFSERWDWSVSDLSLIPREYLRVDEAKINGAVRSGVRSIPGMRIFSITSTRVVAGK